MIRRLILFVLAAALLVCGASAEEIPGIVRLHVVAEDDSEAAQQLKRELRDVCLRCAEACIGDAADADAAYMRLEAHAGDFEAACRARARELGYEGEVRAETGVFAFPDRLYGDVLVPAGEYRALRITIGEGGGHNWWCVLYPTLCIVNEEDAASGEMVYYEKVLGWLRARFGGAV
ncbi:MAG: stage II sporulation protein R [Clostridia bacterium]|nr:stage II sporulation protein R [Clostridia bacterium]